MITDYFQNKQNKHVVQTEFYEIHRSFLQRNKFKIIFNEISQHLQINSSRKSCVCLNENLISTFNLYNLPKINWTSTAEEIKNKILYEISNEFEIDYGLVHYYHDEKSTINWHSDKEALQSNIYLVSIGGARRFCLRDKITNIVNKFDLYDGDLFIMKIGCQNRYEHCIKSIKQFNEPRVSITFRQIEKPCCYYTLFKPNYDLKISEEMPSQNNYKILFSTKENIIFGIVNETETETTFTNIINNNKYNLLLKSNLQKAIRRKNTFIASLSAIEMIKCEKATDLLRRLSIISFEDLKLNKYYPQIVWFYVALINKYELTNNDVNFIWSYVKYLCGIDISNDWENLIFEQTNSPIVINNFKNNKYCMALYIRLQFGGFDEEKKIMQNLINCIKYNDILIYEKDLIIEEYSLCADVRMTYLESSIDFHCFSKMPEKILIKIKADKYYDDKKYPLDEQLIKEYIWKFDSNLNVRKTIYNIDENEYYTWTNIIKPKCDKYRQKIGELLELNLVK